MKYIVVCTGVENEKGKRFEEGEEISKSDFPVKVLKHWAKTGRIEEIGGEENGDG